MSGVVHGKYESTFPVLKFFKGNMVNIKISRISCQNNVVLWNDFFESNVSESS